jgi:hypothetical protein
MRGQQTTFLLHWSNVGVLIATPRVVFVSICNTGQVKVKSLPVQRLLLESR